jgi:hypothetical protein
MWYTLVTDSQRSVPEKTCAWVWILVPIFRIFGMSLGLDREFYCVQDHF